MPAHSTHAPSTDSVAHGDVRKSGASCNPSIITRRIHLLTAAAPHAQERVWKKEKEALEERKKLQQLQKELEQERAVQELQRLQEAAGGKTREQRVDWMYAAPAEGSGPNPDELEAYLLGKKRVDKLLKGNEEKVGTARALGAQGTQADTTRLPQSASRRPEQRRPGQFFPVSPECKHCTRHGRQDQGRSFTRH